MRGLSLSKGDQAGDSFGKLERELDEMNNTLLLDYMMKNEPFETLPTQYIPHEGLDHHPPKFQHGVALTTAQLVGYARKHGLATDQIDSSHPSWSIIIHEVECRLHEQLEVNPEDGILFWSKPWTKNEELKVLLSFRTNYNRDINVADPAGFIKRLEEQLGQPAKWYMRRPNDDGPALRTHYKISADKMKAQAARVAKVKRAARVANQKV
ncbi:hypothetical protein PM082_011929 [Marasmius tenuissimus]|nr:hypothetical protein PM082_011929 [Marasmius tenuissimus]